MENAPKLMLLIVLALLSAPAAMGLEPEGRAGGRAADPSFSMLTLPFSPDFRCAAWAPDGTSMVLAGPDGWIASYHPINRTFVDLRARGAARLPDYCAVAMSSATGEALVVGEGGVAVSVASGGRMDVLPTGTTDDLNSVAFIPDGSRAWLVGENRTLVEFDAVGRKMTVQDTLLLPDLADLPPDIAFGAIAFGPGTQYGLVAAPEAGRIFRLSDSSLVDISYKFSGLSAPAGISWSPDGLRAFVVDNTSRAYLWDGKAETCTPISGPPLSQIVISAWRDAGSAALLSLGQSPGLCYYSGQPALALSQPMEVSSFRAMSWSPAGTEGFIFAAEGQLPVAYGYGREALPAPAGPVLSEINATAVYLTWSWSPGGSGERLDHFILLHSTSQADLHDATPLNASTNTSGRLYNLIPSTRYYLLIRVVTQNGLTADSESQSFSTTALQPPEPVVPYFEDDTLRWTPSGSPGIAKYDLYYSQRGDLAVEGMAFVRTFPAGQAGYAYDLSPQLGSTYREGVSYYFRVRTVNGDGATGDSAHARFLYNTAPPAVSAVKVTDITYNSVRLAWGKSGAADFAAYIIEYREYNKGTWKTALRVFDQNATSAVVGNLAADTRYDFRIKVQDAGEKTSAVTVWAVHPRTSENIPYEIFSTLFGDPVVCLPVSFILLFMTAAAAAGMAKSRHRAGSAVFGAFSTGFGILVLANLLQLTEVFQFSPEQKLFLFLLPLPVAAAIAIARRARRAQNEARTRAESESRAAGERAAEQRRRAEEVRAALTALGPRLVALESVPGQPGAAAVRAMLQQAGYAFSSGQLDSAQELANRADTGIREMENANREKTAKAETISKRLESIDTRLRTLIEHWQQYDPASELGLDPLRIDRPRLDAARKEEDQRLQVAQARQQQAGVLLGQGRLAQADDIAGAAQADVDRLFDFWNGWKDLKHKAASLAAGIESAASWAAIDGRAYRRRLEEAKLALAVQDGAAAAAALNAVTAELGSLGQTHRPMLLVGLPPREYRLNRFEDFQFTVRNSGKALARKIDIGLDAPADFGPGGAQPYVKLVSMAPGGAQECRLNLAFTREGSVPVLFTASCEDSAGNRVVQEPIRLTVTVLGR